MDGIREMCNASWSSGGRLPQAPGGSWRFGPIQPASIAVTPGRLEPGVFDDTHARSLHRPSARRTQQGSNSTRDATFTFGLPSSTTPTPSALHQRVASRGAAQAGRTCRQIGDQRIIYASCTDSEQEQCRSAATRARQASGHAARDQKTAATIRANDARPPSTQPSAPTPLHQAEHQHQAV